LNPSLETDFSILAIPAILAIDLAVMAALTRLFQLMAAPLGLAAAFAVLADSSLQIVFSLSDLLFTSALVAIMVERANGERPGEKQ